MLLCSLSVCLAASNQTLSAFPLEQFNIPTAQFNIPEATDKAIQATEAKQAIGGNEANLNSPPSQVQALLGTAFEMPGFDTHRPRAIRNWEK